METTIALVRALSIGQLAQHEAKHKTLTDKAVRLRAELNQTLRLLAAEEVEVARFRAIVSQTDCVAMHNHTEGA